MFNFSSTKNKLSDVKKTYIDISNGQKFQLQIISPYDFTRSFSILYQNRRVKNSNSFSSQIKLTIKVSAFSKKYGWGFWCISWSSLGSCTGKSLSEALLFAKHGENMLCTKKNSECQKQFLYKTCSPQVWAWNFHVLHCRLELSLRKTWGYALESMGDWN